MTGDPNIGRLDVVTAPDGAPAIAM